MSRSFIRSAAVAAMAALGLLPAAPAAAQPKPLEIYWIDVEGGAATLLISPSGESLLFDAGWEIGDRDAARIAATATQAGLTKIDHFVLSHFHADHAGGIAALGKRIPIGRCFDRGDFIEPPTRSWRDAYLSVCGSKRTILAGRRPDSVAGVQSDVIASNGKLAPRRRPPPNGGTPNPLCATAEQRRRTCPRIS